MWPTIWARRGWTLKSFRKCVPPRRWTIPGILLLVVGACLGLSAKGELPSWIRNIEANTLVERAFFRAMGLPYGDVLFRRPPSETRPALSDLIQQQPGSVELYSLRALEDEQQLDFVAAEKDWKLYAEKARDRTAAQGALGNFFHRRLRPQDEIGVLRTIGDSASTPGEKFTPPREQGSWNAFERILGVIQARALG